MTKHWATDWLSANPDGGPSLLNGWLSLTYTTNSGAAFGVLADRSVLFVLIGLVVLAVLVAYWRFLPGKRLLLRLSLGLQLGGALGNLLDRLRAGHVIDFLQIRYWPVFNLADSSIVLGVAMLMYYLMTTPPAQGTRSPTRSDPGQA